MALAALIATIAPPGARAQGPADWHTAVQGLLQQRARAVMTGAKGTFDATMALAPGAFRASKDTWFSRVRALPLGSYTLSFDPNGYQDLADALLQRPAADEVHVATVLEQIALKPYDATPSSEDLFLTVVRRGATWSIVSDTDLDSIGLLSFRNVWDFAPVGQIARDGVLVLYQGDRATAQRILTATIAAIAYDNGRWPLTWPGRIVMIIPQSTRELSRILQTTFDLGPFVAFTASSESRPSGQYRLSGNRVYVQPGTFFNTPVAYQQDTLSHELLHVATRGYAGGFTPSWMDEGDAQAYGQRQQPALVDVRARVQDHTFTGVLPEDFEFSLGSDDDIHDSYQEASSFVLYLISRFGKSAGANLYRALGNESPVSFGTAGYHLDHACRAAFGVGFADLERAWAQKIRKEFG
ncbi:MAG TPA: hypothetical protein VGW79_03010 [Actinomycetota bacterium]|nr:hypothetical protein [Actinomycetota bacterium]